MIRHVSADPLDRSRFPIDEWRLVEVEPGETDGHNGDLVLGG